MELLHDREEFGEIKLLVRSRNDSRLDKFSNLKKCKFVEGDLSNRTLLVNECKDMDFIIHCAAISSDWASWDSFFQSNVLGTKNMVDAALSCSHLRRFLHVSSTDVYGYPSDAELYSESTSTVMTSLPYNKSKCMAEEIVWKASSSIPITIIRPSNVVCHHYC